MFLSFPCLSRACVDVEAHVPYAHALAVNLWRAYEARGVRCDCDDAKGEAVLGMLRAAETYDPSHGTSFTSYAFWHIRGQLLRHFRDRCRLIRIPAYQQGKGKGGELPLADTAGLMDGDWDEWGGGGNVCLDP